MDDAAFAFNDICMWLDLFNDYIVGLYIEEEARLEDFGAKAREF